MLLYVTLALSAVAMAATLLALFRGLRILTRALSRRFAVGLSPNQSAAVMLVRGVAGSATGVRDVDAIANLDPNTLQPRYHQRTSLQKPWGW